MPRTPAEELTNTVKDAAYVSVGLGVIAFQRLQVRRNELVKALNGPAEEARGTLELLATLVGERVKVVEERVGSLLNRD